MRLSLVVQPYFVCYHLNRRLRSLTSEIPTMRKQFQFWEAKSIDSTCQSKVVSNPNCQCLCEHSAAHVMSKTGAGRCNLLVTGSRFKVHASNKISPVTGGWLLGCLIIIAMVSIAILHRLSLVSRSTSCVVKHVI